ncbi:MAG: hypothetical protein QF689_01815 [Candidatus Latescibacteria bacterium]|jgi:hypothetical protein|nr:hypothetical protein [Gemmatimonadaceae bacterium]MDP6017013.1 hypothetical protein [Candidatus Latescibacterota bacterium]MDP7447300.1 hypothetical protein [Candidatus Latescibacterota bacterium]HJP32747.1 hypothetical protein [Candidatus Latescibacterota bacterium]
MADRIVPWKADALCLGGLALAVVGFFPQVVIDGGCFFVQDMMVQNVPFRHFLHEAFVAGRLPLWEPRINAGFPLFAEGQVGALYPPNWAGATLLSPARASTWSVLLHLWAASAGAFLYLRHGLHVGRAGALTAGVCFGLSGYLVVRVMSPSFVAATAGIPFLFLLVESGLQHRRPARLGAAGAVVALQLLAGHPQAASYGALAALGYGAIRAGQLQRVRVAIIGCAIAVPGMLIAAVQLLPTFELAQLSLRAGGIDYAQFVKMSLPPERLLLLLLPDLFGNSAHGSYWGSAEGFFIQLCPFVGVLCLLLAFIGAREGRSTTRFFFVLLALLGLSLSLGRYTGFFELLHRIPLLSQFRIPTRFLLWWAFAIAVLAGLGVDRLVGDPKPLRTPWRLPWAICVLSVIGATAFVWGDGSRETVELAAGAQDVLSHLHADLATGLWRALAVLAVAAVLFSGRFRRQAAAPALTVIAVLVVTWAELHSFAGDFNGVLPEDAYALQPATARAIHQDDRNRQAAAGTEASPEVPAWGRFRIASLISERNTPYDWHAGWALNTSSYRLYAETLRMYSAGLYGLANTTPGWSPLHLTSHWEFSQGYPAWLGLANARYVVTHRPLPAQIAEPVHTGQVSVSRLRQSLPRAWVVPEAIILPAKGARLRHMRSPSFDPRRQVVIDREPLQGPVSGAGFAAVRIVRYEAEHVAIDLPGGDGYLVLSDTYAPGWLARVDGVEREILLANHTFRAVPVLAADKRVEFDYRPGTVVAGAWISGAAMLLWLTLCRLARPGGGTLRQGAEQLHEKKSTILMPLAVQIGLVVALYGFATETELWVGAADRLQPVQILREAFP